MYFIKITNMTSGIASLVSLRNRLGQALLHCSGFFDPVFSKTRGTQTVNNTFRVVSNTFCIFSCRSCTLLTCVEHTIDFKWLQKQKPKWI